MERGCASSFRRSILRSFRRLYFELCPPLHPLLDVLLEPEIRRLVPLLPPERFGEGLLRRVRVLEGMRIPIARAVPELFHQLRGGVPDVERHGLCGVLGGRVHGLAERREDTIRLGRG